MKSTRRTAAVLRESLSAALATPVASLATLIMVAGLCATVLLTTGRTIGAEQAVLTTIDSAGTRTIVVRAEPSAGVDTSVLQRLEGIDGIAWSAAFGQAFDVTNAAFEDGTKVPARLMFGSTIIGLDDPTHRPDVGRTAFASDLALEQLGMSDAVGSVTNADGFDFIVAGSVPTPNWLGFLEPLILIPQQPDTEAIPISLLIVIAERPDLVVALTTAIQSVLAAEDPTKVSIATSESLAQLRALVQGQLGSFGRNLILLMFTVSGVLVASVLMGLVTLRRRDFGRRRALGATRGLIVALVLGQTFLLAGAGAALGSLSATVALVLSGDPLPGGPFTVAVAMLAVVVGLVAASIPALVAARRDPIRELRMP